MKRLFAFLLTLVLAAGILGACSEQPAAPINSTPTQAATEAVTDAPVEVPTDAPTEAPAEVPTEAPTKAPAQETEFIYTDPAGAYQLTVPVIWNGTGLIVEDTYDGNEIVRFLYKDAYYQGAGHVFSVVYVDNPAGIVNVSELPHGEELFNDGQKQVYVIFPTDVQFAPYDAPGTTEFNKQNAEYGALADTRQAILDSFDPQTL